VPRLLNAAKPPQWSAGLVKGHFWCSFAGILISYLALLVGGVGEGILLNDPKNSFSQVMRSTLMPLRSDTLGDLLIVIGTICFLLNFTLLLLRHCCRCWAEYSAQTEKERA
jgi:cbb3-type cytochrome oxidase subunit 1